MGRCYVMKRVLIVAVCCCAWASVTASALAQDPPKLTSRDIIRVLHMQIDSKDFQGPGMPFKDALGIMHDVVVERGALGKNGLGFLVDQRAFKDAAPDAIDLHESQVKFPPLPKTMTLAM